MTDYMIWTFGLRGPAISVLHNSPALNEYDRRVILSGPTKIAPEHEGLSLAELARLYPPPRQEPPEQQHAPEPPDDTSPPSGAPASALVAA